MPHTSLLRCGFVGCLLATKLAAQEPTPFTLQQILSAPYASLLTAAPSGPLFAWSENAEGRHNLFVGGKDIPARQLTHNTEDDAQDISQFAWSPDAKGIAYTFGAPSGADGKPANPAHLQHPTPLQVIVQPLAIDAAPFFIGEGHNPLFTHDGKGLLFIRSGQIWIEDFTGATPQHQLVFDRGTASSLTLSPDGNTLAFISRRREANEPSHSFLALYSLTTHTLTFPAPSTGNDSAPAFSPDGKQIAWLRNPFTDMPEFANPRTSPTPWSIQLLDLTTSTTRTAYSPEPNKPGSVFPDLSTGAPYLLWTADKRIVFYSELDGWLHLYSVNAANNDKPHILTTGAYEVEGATISADRKRLLFSANGPAEWTSYAGSSSPYRRSMPQMKDRRNIWSIDLTSSNPVAVPPHICCSIDTHPQIAGDGSIAALVSDENEPMHLEWMDLQPSYTDARIHALSRLDAFPSEFRKAIKVQPQQALFDSSDGLHLHSQLFLPKAPASNSTKHPAILFVHGGPKRQMLLGYPAMDYYSNAYAMNQYLTSRGFIVLSLNYRCGIGYGLEFRTCQQAGATGATEYNDVLAAQKYLASRPDVDAKRIGIWGGSYGGYLTALALARNSDLFAAGVDFHGVHDWNLEDNASDWKQGSFAEQDAIAAKALASSPLADLSKWRSPILLIHGDNDPDVAYAQTPHLADALRARNSRLPAAQQVDVQELIFPDELHDFLLHRDWLAAYTAAAAFFERTLKP